MVADVHQGAHALGAPAGLRRAEGGHLAGGRRRDRRRVRQSRRGPGIGDRASGSSADTPLAFASITLLALISVVLFYAIVALERMLVPWAREITG